jgi:heme A synthase
MNHMRRWGVVYLLAALFGGSWVGQLAAQFAEGDGWVLFLSNTFENWQSEFLQLAVQALAVVAGAKVMFRKSVEDQMRLEAKVDELLRQNVLRKTER